MVRRELNRIPPKLPPRANVTYQLHAPFSTHWRKATCEEFGCLAHRNGWRVNVSALPPQKVHAAMNSGRRYSVLDLGPGEKYLVFEPGQPCFQSDSHRLRVERPEIFVARGGDYRRYVGSHRQFKGRRGAADWVESFAENQGRLAMLAARG